MVTKVQWLQRKMCDSWVAYCRTPSRRNPQWFYGRAQKSWDQFDEYDSQELRSVMQTSEKQTSIAEWNTSQGSSSAQSLPYEIWGLISGGDWKTRAMRLRRRVETCQKHQKSSKKRAKLHSFHLPMSGVCHPQYNRRKESLWWTPEQVCIWSAGKTSTLQNWIP